MKKVKIASRQIERIKGVNALLSNFLVHPTEDELKDLETLVVFIGSERSGSTIGGSLLDAHPDIIISTEFNLVHQITYGLSKEKLAKLMLFSSASFKRKGANWTGYSYNIPGLYQGEYKTLKVIGDKKANSSAWLFSDHPERVAELEEIFGVPIKMVHMIRHPLDVIATISKRSLDTMEEAMEFYFKTIRCSQEVIQAHPDKVITLRHEDLCSTPRETLKKLTTFIGVGTSEEYLEKCAGLISLPTKKSRERVEWRENDLTRIRDYISHYDFLSSYQDF